MKLTDAQKRALLSLPGKGDWACRLSHWRASNALVELGLATRKNHFGWQAYALTPAGIAAREELERSAQRAE